MNAVEILVRLDDDKFKTMFYETMEHLAELEKVNATYKIRAYRNETKWKGINLTKLRIDANNNYDCWLKLDKIFQQHSVNNYDRQFIMDVGFEECEDLEIAHSMENYVKAFINLFAENDTLWPVKI